jgi:hypothetical protein
MTLAHADVIGVATATAASNAAEPTHPTPDHGSQKGGRGGSGAAGTALMVRKVPLDQITVLLADDRWNVSHGEPLLRTGLNMSSPTMTTANHGAAPSTRLRGTTASDVDRSCRDRRSENTADGRLIPSGSPCRTRDAQARQALSLGFYALAFLAIG